PLPRLLPVPTRRSSDLGRPPKSAGAGPRPPSWGNSRPPIFGASDSSPSGRASRVLVFLSAPAPRFSAGHNFAGSGPCCHKKGQRSEEHTSELQSRFDLV